MLFLRIIGLFVVVFGGLIVTRTVGLSEQSQIIGLLIGGGTYILTQLHN